MPKKLIEVALPLEAINKESAREKTIRHGHPSTLHLWWARRPLATARAVIWASLVDDPSSHPEFFPTEEDQIAERQRLFNILINLVKWENSNNEVILNKAKAEILKYNNNKFPKLLDPFAGGGAIPLEAQRLGLKVYAHDLNPVSVVINKSMIEFPPRFCGTKPVNPISAPMNDSGEKIIGLTGMAEDFDYYSTLLKKRALTKLENNYPLVEVSGKMESVIAWLWARTVKCPNPACGAMTPLVKSFTLSKKKNIYIDPQISNKKIKYKVIYGDKTNKSKNGTIGRSGAKCIFCGSSISLQYIREQGKLKKLSNQMIGIVCEGNGSRDYVSPDENQIKAANVIRPDTTFGQLANYPGYINPVAYGFDTIESLFSDRQLVEINTLIKLIPSIKEEILEDAIKNGMPYGKPLTENGKGALAYSEALTTYLCFLVDKIADYHTSICSWNSSREIIRNTFGMTGISMTWDYAEANPFSHSSGCFDNMKKWIYECLNNFKSTNAKEGTVEQFDAQEDCGLRNILVSTDPPYYSNVPYADFSDFFYSIMRFNLKDIFPSMFGTVLTPKIEELVADPYRSGSKENAAIHFEKGMLQMCKQLYKYTSSDYPVTIYYAFKQNDVVKKNGTSMMASTGWEKMLEAIINAGFCITGTWPVRTELSNRTRSIGANALASSIVLVCRKRNNSSNVCTKREFVILLKKEFKIALKQLKNANIAPVDLAQASIGPGIGVFSRYSKVLESDGSEMTVRSALAIINEEIDAYFNEEDSDLDSLSRFCVDLYTQSAFNEIPFGDADTLARAKNISVSELAKIGIVHSAKGRVSLTTRDEIPEYKLNQTDARWLAAQQLTKAMNEGGIEAAATIVSEMNPSVAEHAKDLVYRLFTIADKKNRAQEAFEYNNLVVAWSDIQNRARQINANKPKQMSFFDQEN